MSKKRNTNEGFIECPFDEEDIISSADYKTLINSETKSLKPSNKPREKCSNLFFFQSTIIRLERSKAHPNFSRQQSNFHRKNKKERIRWKLQVKPTFPLPNSKLTKSGKQVFKSEDAWQPGLESFRGTLTSVRLLSQILSPCLATLLVYLTFSLDSSHQMYTFHRRINSQVQTSWLLHFATDFVAEHAGFVFVLRVRVL